jgi:tetratricopeptide (TPR) repeat protein
MRRPGLLVVLLGILLGACQGSPPPPPAANADLATQAAEALARGDHARAAALYERALADAPESLPVHYGLAVAASHLERRELAIREFRWVLARGPEGAPEVEAARRWLARVGALSRPAAAPAPALDDGREPGHASLEGRALLAEAGQEPGPAQRMTLVLIGQPGSPAEEERYNLRTDQNGHFKFPNVVPGTYMLTDRIAGRPHWRLRTELKPSQELILDLTPANGIAVRDDFPDRL